MRHGLAFLGLTALFVAVAAFLGLASWGGIAGLVTAGGLLGPAVAYLFDRPALLGKQADGRIAAWARGVHASYFALCRLGWLAQRGEGPDELRPGLFVGPRATPLQSLALRRDRSVATLDLCCELPELGTLRRGTYLSLPVLDGRPLRPAQLDVAVAFIDEHLEDHNVLVHCAVGRGRSAAVALAWLLARGEASGVDEALELLVQKRPVAAPSAGQLGAVADWYAALELRQIPLD